MIEINKIKIETKELEAKLARIELILRYEYRLCEKDDEVYHTTAVALTQAQKNFDAADAQCVATYKIIDAKELTKDKIIKELKERKQTEE